jgi:hypothetical protein
LAACGGQSTSDASGGSANTGGAGGTGATGGTGGAGGGAGAAACPAAKTDVMVCVKAPYGPPIDLSLAGAVLSTGPVQGSGECLGAPHSADSFFVEMADAAGTTWHVELSLPGFANPFAAGQTLALDAHYQAPEFGPTIASATLRDASGALVVYVGEGGDIGDLVLPSGIALARGDSLCTEDDGCGLWSAYDLLVSAGGTQKTLHYGTSETVGSWLVTHGGYEHSIGGGSHGCMDWFKAHLAVGVVPSP